MLDLSKVNDKLYEIKMLDGEILHIRKPSQKILNNLIEVQKLASDESNSAEVVRLMYDIVLVIFNSNTDGKEYDNKYVEVFDIETVGIIINDYIMFTSDKLGE